MENNHTNNLSKGLDLSKEALYQEDNSYTFGLNIINESQEGEIFLKQTEPGNILCAELKKGYKVIGQCNGEDDSIYIFSTDDNLSEIGLLKDCNYTTLVNTNLKFNRKHLIKATYRKKNNCSEFLYFVDGNSEDKYFEITQPDKFKTNGQWDYFKFLFKKRIKNPIFKNIEVSNTGGNLESGKYFFSIEYLDYNKNILYNSPITEGVIIYEDSTSGAYDMISGSQKVKTNKAIFIDLENIDERVAYLNLNTIRYISGDGISYDVVKSKDYQVLSDELTIPFTGYNPSNGDVPGDLNSLLIQSTNYKSKTLVQAENRLLKANLKEDHHDWKYLQKYANNIEVKYGIKNIAQKGIKYKNQQKNPNVTNGNMSLMGDEVYPLAIVYVHKEFGDSPPIHIPGRKKDLVDDVLGNSQSGHIRPKAPKGQWDSHLINNIDSKYTSCLEVSAEDSCIKSQFVLKADGLLNNNKFSEGKLNVELNNFDFDKVTITLNNNLVYNFTDLPIQIDLKDIPIIPAGFEPVDLLIFEIKVYKLQTEIYTKRLLMYNNLFSAPPGYNYIFFEDVSLTPVSVSERWRVYNTAIKDKTPVDSCYSSSGIMAYYESCTHRYPETKDCDGNLIYPHTKTIDSNGKEQILMDFIRHHKMPDRRLEHQITHSDKGDAKKTRHINLIFDNVVYPNDDIIGHYFVYATNQKTILDKGVIIPCPERASNQFGFSGFNKLSFGNYVFNETASYDDNLKISETSVRPISKYVNTYVSAASQLYRPALFGDYIKGETIMVCDPNRKLHKKITFANGNDDRMDEIMLNGTSSTYNHRIMESSFGNIGIKNFYYLNPRTSAYFDSELFSNVSYRNTIAGIQTKDRIIPNPTNAEFDSQIDYRPVSNLLLNYVAIKTNRSVYNDLYSINYIKLNNEIYTTKKNFVDGGDVFISELKLFDVIGYSFNIPGFLVKEKGMAYIAYKDGIYVESYYNSELLNNVNNYRGVSDKAVEDYFIQTHTKRDDVIYDPPKEVWSYNLDYNVKNHFKLIRNSFVSECKDCDKEFPYRIIFSSKSYDEDIYDNYLNFYANDYIDIPQNKGPITNLLYKNGNIIIVTENSAFIIKPNASTLKIDDNSTAYLSSGDFLSIPEREILETDLGYLGCQSSYSFVNNELSASWVDAKNGNIIFYNDNLNIITNNYLTQWFKENLPFKMLEKFENYPFLDSPSYRYGLGIVCIYDHFFKRLLVTKKDFKPIIPYKIISYKKDRYNLKNYNSFVYDTDSQSFGILYPDFTYREIPFTDSKYFENCSWTISYDYKTQQFTSFHSYIPYFYLYNKNEFFSIIDNKIYKHLRATNYGKFYDKKYPHIIEAVYNNMITSDLNSIYLITKAFKFNQQYNNFERLDNETFKKLIVYNDTQSTGLLDLKVIDYYSDPYGNIEFNPTTKSIIQTDDNFKIAQLHDVLINNPVFDKSWSLDKAVQFDENGYIDKVLVDVNHDYTKNIYEYNNIKEKYNKVRLYYINNEEDIKLLIFAIIANKSESIR